MKTFKETIVIIALALPMFASAQQGESFVSYTMFSETIRGLNGIHFDGTLGLGYAKDVWSDPKGNDDGTKKRMISKDGKMALEFNGLDEYRDEVITWTSLDSTQKAAVTVFKDKRPESHTFVLGGEGFTINLYVCEILREQTGSTTMDDLAARAKTCNDFFKTKPIPTKVFENLSDLEQTHSGNLQRLRNSVAKDIFPKSDASAKPVTGTVATPLAGIGTWIEDFMASTRSRSETPKAMPRSAKDIFSPKQFKDGTSYRQALAEVGEACARFYPTASPTVDAAASQGPSSGRTTGK